MRRPTRTTSGRPRCSTRLPGMVVPSGDPSDLYDRLFDDWECVTREFYGSTEALWLNPATVRAGRMKFEQPLALEPSA